MNTETLQSILEQLWPELPALVGEAWVDLGPRLTRYWEQLLTGEIDPAIVQAYILRDLSAHPAAYQRLLTLTHQAKGVDGAGVWRSVRPVSSDISGRESAMAPVEQTPGLTRYTDISCPRRAWIETPRVSVVVRLTVEQPEHSAAEDALTGLATTPVQVRLSAPGFDLLNPPLQETPIVPDQDSPPLVFDLKPKQTGHTYLLFDFLQDGQPLRTVTVPVEIMAHEVAQEMSNQLRQQLVNPTAPPPDLVLHIGWDQATRSLEFTLIRGGGAWWRSFQPVQLATNPADHAFELYRRITSLANAEDATFNAAQQQRLIIPAADVDRQLRKLGNDLWDTLLPPDLRQLYSEERQRWQDRSLLIYSDEPHLPWELVWPYDQINGEWQDETPWCITTQLTRWLRRDAQGNGNEAAPGQLTLRHAAVLAPSYQQLSPLPATVAERDLLKTLFAAHTITDLSPTDNSWGRVMDLLEGGGYDWMHFASHGSFYPAAPASDSALWLDQDRSLNPEHLTGAAIVRHFRQRRPAFVFNACEVGRQGWALTRIGGWANQLVRLNASLFVGPLWIVSDSGAATFASAFYGALLDGATVAVAVRLARLACRTAGDPTWLAYSVYAHPNAKLVNASG